jgi:hypothetical protein
MQIRYNNYQCWESVIIGTVPVLLSDPVKSQLITDPAGPGSRSNLHIFVAIEKICCQIPVATVEINHTIFYIAKLDPDSKADTNIGYENRTDELKRNRLRGTFLDFSFYVRYSTLLHLPPSDSTVPEDAGIDPRTVATTALDVRRSNHLARSHPQRNRCSLRSIGAFLSKNCFV